VGDGALGRQGDRGGQGCVGLRASGSASQPGFAGAGAGQGRLEGRGTGRQSLEMRLNGIEWDFLDKESSAADHNPVLGHHNLCERGLGLVTEEKCLSARHFYRAKIQEFIRDTIGEGALGLLRCRWRKKLRPPLKMDIVRKTELDRVWQLR